MASPGFRRRVLIEPAQGHVTAELEDDWHRMVVTLHHQDGVIATVESEMKRSPWTSCPGAMDRLAETFCGANLAEVARRGEKTTNCTHLYDLTLFAAAHANEVRATLYDIAVADPVDGRQTAQLSRDGAQVIQWVIEGDTLAAPAGLAGLRLTKLGDFIAGLDPAGQEAARLLRWAAIMSCGRQMDIPDHAPATMFPPGACFNFQPAQATHSTRRPAAARDFSLPGQAPMADNPAIF